MDHVDVIVVGAGISGIGAGFHLQDQCPDRRYMILEGRAAIGGTWDLFRYPGIRSDSDMFTLGYSFEPWIGDKAIADGPSIRDYVNRVAVKYGIDRHIRFNHRVTAASWSSADARWTVTAVTDGREVSYTCNFLYMCSGYYNYDRGHLPDFPGADDFAGRLIEPQFWPEDLDYAGKRVVVIGSGATAVTIVPEMAKTAAQVTMLQRSPTYVVSRPSVDTVANGMRKWLPSRLVYGLIRWRNVLFQLYFYNAARKYPARAKERMLELLSAHLPGEVIAEHFTPRYNVWDQRVCLVPDADFFSAINAGRASVVTDHIERFDKDGIVLKSGARLDADIVVAATGLELQLLAGIPISLDGAAVDFSQTVQYKGMMFSGVPNLALSIGYSNASWTLKSDLIAAYVCRLLNTMRRRGRRVATPQYDPAMPVANEPFFGLSSGYVQRAMDRFPKQGAETPWRLHQNYARDLLALRFGSVDDAMVFSDPAQVPADAPAAREPVSA